MKNDYYQSREDRLQSIYGSPHTPTAPSHSKIKRVLLVLGLLILVALISVISCAVYMASIGYSPFVSKEFSVNQNTSPVMKVSNTSSGTLTTPEISEKLKPSVVYIETSSQMSKGSGSGIVFSSDGYIITNQHVVAGAQAIKVVLDNRKEYEATIVGQDEKTDLAVIKIDANDLTAAEIGDSDQLVQGEFALIIGNPLGETLSGSVSQGIISALGREIEIQGRTMRYIQTDAAINSGNSGGPLVNSSGLVVGIASAKINSAVGEGLGFAIPINNAIPIIEDLINHGYVTGRPVIGISGEAITSQIAMFYNLPQGVYVRYVAPNSAAAKAKIQPGDIITALNGVSVSTVAELNNQRDNFKAGDTVKLTIYRGTSTIEVPVVLQDASAEDANPY